jgi:hypothetical protein
MQVRIFHSVKFRILKKIFLVQIGVFRNYVPSDVYDTNPVYYEFKEDGLNTVYFRNLKRLAEAKK